MDFTKLDEKYNDLKKSIQEIENDFLKKDNIDIDKLKEQLAAKYAVYILKSNQFSKEFENLAKQFIGYWDKL